MSLMNSIQQWGNTPMQFVSPIAPPALSGNPELAKAAMYSGGGQQPGVGGGTPAGGAPAGGAPAGGAPAAGGTSGIMAQIMKLLGSSGGSGGIDPAMLMSLFGG